MAHTNIHSLPFGNHGRTMRLIVENNAQSSSLWVRFSNRCGTRPLVVGDASLALCNPDGSLLPGSLFPLTVGGVLAFEIPAGEDLISDTVRFPLSPGEHFTLNLYYPENSRLESGNWMGGGTLRSRPGNFSADVEFPAPGLVSRFSRTVVAAGLTTTTATVAQIVAESPQPGNVIACFGDSITQQGNWTTPFQKLLYHKFPGKATLCNLGIGGNRLLFDSPAKNANLYGLAGMARFEADVLNLPGVTHCILALGTNDIGIPDSLGAPKSELITPAQFANAMETLATQLHKRNIKAYLCTLCPRHITGVYDALREGIRLAINAWIRTSPHFDAVIDFDAALRRADGAPGMQEDYALPDGLHPSPLGGMIMAKHIDLSLFEEVTHG